MRVLDDTGQARDVAILEAPTEDAPVRVDTAMKRAAVQGYDDLVAYWDAARWPMDGSYPMRATVERRMDRWA